MAQHWVGGSDGWKGKQTNKRDHPGHSTERRGSVGRKKRRNQAAQPNHPRDAPNPDLEIPKHLKQPKEKGEDHMTQRLLGTTQGEKLRSQDAETKRNNPTRRTQKNGKLSSVVAAWNSTNHGRASWIVYITFRRFFPSCRWRHLWGDRAETQENPLAGLPTKLVLGD